ncbi:hypothetical protein B0T19DRAFT_470503 [Cercophora scortea]|uniref:BTB domain-containing protein n=1 Tax=Cercophora scortea TaxID=314031 RepID=A0AAE0MJS8_9PEZI|nr:hypothetical protein B0T19DRAFT_470503 [Cercophora scortea]
MDSLHHVVVPSPFANMTPLYEIAPEADLLLIIPPYTPPSPSGGAPTQGLRLKLSSAHLSLASRAFRTKLQQKHSKQSDNRTHLSLPATGEFDPRAVTIVMNALHGRGSKVPRTLEGGVEILASIAKVVETFGVLEAVAVYADRWIDGLVAKGLPREFGREAVLWVYATRVFRRAEVFREITAVVAAGAVGVVDGFGFALGEKVVRDIESQRQQLVSAALDILDDVVDELADGLVPCEQFDCDSFLLGKLVKTLRKSKLFPRPASPFAGVGLAGIEEAIDKSGLQIARRSDDSVLTEGGLWTTTPKNTIVKALSQSKKTAPPRQQQQRPFTPESSPEPAAARSSGRASVFGEHQCEARKLVGTLEAIHALCGGVRGLELESELGYLLY